MLNKLLDTVRSYRMIQPGDTVICALSGGADSVALFFGLYLLRQKLGFTLEAAHFDHGLRGEESRRDAAFVQQLCSHYDVALHLCAGNVTAGKKGLEAAARDARYGFFESLSGRVATAHTADDNAETVLMHLVRGTGLKGLGGIAPVRGKYIRPLLDCTRQDVLAFLEEYHLTYVEDSSNKTDDYLRNRLRHHVMPLLKGENPRLAQNLSAMAQSLRLDEQALEEASNCEAMEVTALRQMPEAVRARAIARFLKENGVKEPEKSHIDQVNRLVFSENPSAAAHLPGGVQIQREYGILAVAGQEKALETVALSCPGYTDIPQLGLRVFCQPAEQAVNDQDAFTVDPVGALYLRSRKSGDSIRLPGGTKSLKKLFIDRKIPAAKRSRIPVICDDEGILGVYGAGVNLDRAGSRILIRFGKR